jgi:hypothetical protein
VHYGSVRCSIDEKVQRSSEGCIIAQCKVQGAGGGGSSSSGCGLAQQGVVWLSRVQCSSVECSAAQWGAA